MAAPFAQLKRCYKCKAVKPRDEFHKDSGRRDGCQASCRSCVAERGKRRYQENRGYFADHKRRNYAANRQAYLQYARDYAAALKAQVLAHYGTACACCGSADDPTVDHINGDGRQFRESLIGGNKGGGMAVYRWIIANDFPEDLQTLCRSCNRSKGTGERCRIDHRDPSELAEADRRPCGHSWAEVRSDRDGCAACHRETPRQRRAAKNNPEVSC